MEEKENENKEAIEYFKKHNRIWEVDLEYNDDCKLKTYKMPLAPEKKIPLIIAPFVSSLLPNYRL